jgi:hypothetical protein
MQKKRLENALKASKLMQIGFRVNQTKPDKINLLYSVNCINHKVQFTDQQFFEEPVSKQVVKRGLVKPLARIEEADDSDLSSDSEPDTSRGKNDSQSISQKSNKSNESFEEKIEILCIKFNEPANLMAEGDSNGNINVRCPEYIFSKVLGLKRLFN